MLGFLPLPLRATAALCVLLFTMAGIFTLGLGGCPQTPATNDNENSTANDNGTSNNNTANTNTNSSSNTNSSNGNGGTIDPGGGIENLNANDSGNTNTNGGDDVGGEDPPPTALSWDEIVRTGDAVPGQTAGCTFTTFSSPIVDADGRVAFWARHAGGDGLAGLYVWADGELQVVVDDSGNFDVPAATPGDVTTESFGPYQELSNFILFQEPIAWSSAGRLLFVSRFSGPGNRALFRWNASDESLLRVGDAASVAEAIGVSSTASLITFSNIGRSDEGAVLFQARFTSLSPMLSGTLVCRVIVTSEDGIVVTLLAPVGTIDEDYSEPGVPDQDADAIFYIYSPNTTLAPNGRMLFQGAYDNGTGTHGLYMRVGDTVYRVVDDRPDSEWEGLDAGTVVGDEDFYGAVAISQNNHIALQAPLISGSDTQDSVLLWDFAAGAWTILSVDDEPATVLLSGVSDGGAVLALVGDVPYVMDRTAAVSVAETLPTELTGVDVIWGADVGAINNLGHAVVPYTRADELLALAFWTGDELLVLADAGADLPVADIAEVQADSLPEKDRPARSSIINDSDEAVFRVKFTDDDEAIYIGRAE